MAWTSGSVRWWVVAAGLVMASAVGALVGGGHSRLAVGVVGLMALGVALARRPYGLVFGGAILVFSLSSPILGIPLAEIGAAFMILGIVAARTGSWSVAPALLVTVSMLVIWLVFVAFGQFGDPSVAKRFTSLVLWLGLLIAVSVDSHARVWIARGLAVGLAISIPASLIVDSYFAPRWGGFIGDPNVFGMIVTLTVPLIADTLGPKVRWKISVWLLGGGLVVMADSRTSMLALVTSAVVYAMLPYVRAWAMGVPVLVMWGASIVPDDVVRGGRWEDRLGSDQLRSTIDAASLRQIRENLWTGQGLGSGKVNLREYGDSTRDLVFFLHNSYRALITEVGLIGISLYAVLTLGAVVQGLKGSIARGALASIAAGAVMATQLGEVLFAIPAALALGFAWAGSSAESAPRWESKGSERGSRPAAGIPS